MPKSGPPPASDTSTTTTGNTAEGSIFSPQVSIEKSEDAIPLIGQQRAGEADLIQNGPQRIPLGGWMPPPVARGAPEVQTRERAGSQQFEIGPLPPLKRVLPISQNSCTKHLTNRRNIEYTCSYKISTWEKRTQTEGNRHHEQAINRGQIRKSSHRGRTPTRRISGHTEGPNKPHVRFPDHRAERYPGIANRHDEPHQSDSQQLNKTRSRAGHPGPHFHSQGDRRHGRSQTTNLSERTGEHKYLTDGEFCHWSPGSKRM